jgi:hypothetical protein
MHFAVRIRRLFPSAFRLIVMYYFQPAQVECGL